MSKESRGEKGSRGREITGEHVSLTGVLVWAHPYIYIYR